MPKPNEKLLTTTLELVKDNKARWDQGDWRRNLAEDPDSPSCGTAMCFAGWAVVADHGRFVVPENKAANVDGEARYDLELVYARKDEIDAGVAMLHKRTGKHVVQIYERAQRALGLTQDQADVLFEGSNNLPTLRRHVKALIAGKSIISEE